MRKWSFVLSAAAILLVGALAAGAAARRVVEPPAGEVWSAGEVPVPTVLGQTAEEVLFFPWSLYDTETLYPVPEEFLLDGINLRAIGDTLEEVARKLKAGATIPADEDPAWIFRFFENLMPADIPWKELLSSLEWNVDPSGDRSSDALQIFLRDLPAAGQTAGEDVTLSFAIQDGERASLSYLVRPAEPREITPEEQSKAMALVEQDLRTLFLSRNVFESGMGALLQSFLEGSGMLEGGYGPPHDLHGLFLYGNPLSGGEPWPLPDVEEFYDAPLEDFLLLAEEAGLPAVQIVTTQSQILVIFTLADGNVLGIYYDIQLGRYSGVGYMS